MCGQYAIVSSIEKIEKKFRLKPNEHLNFKTNVIVSPGLQGLVITNEEPKMLQSFKFGFTPSWSKKQTYVINARAEGDRNKDNDPNYTGAKGIISKPFFKKAIRKQRCLVIADCFLEGTIKEKLKKPYLVYLRNDEKPFAFAGVWDRWSNKETGEIVDNFAIITAPPNKLMLKIPHNRMPVILPQESHSRYLSESVPLSDITPILNQFPPQLMNAYPVSPDYKEHKEDAAKALQPTGQRLEKEYEYKIHNKIKLFGMGESPSREKSDLKKNK